MAIQPDIGAGLREIASQSSAAGLDPLAVISVARFEGLSGGIGDGGHAYGPFQLNNAGGVITGRYAGNPAYSDQIQSWAWSPEGIRFAIQRIAAVTRGTTGTQAIYRQVTLFERPKDPSSEIQKAAGYYAELQSRRSSILSATGQLLPGATSIISTAGTGSAADAGSGDIGSVVGGAGGAIKRGVGDIAAPIAGPIGSIEDALKFLFSYRFLEIVGGLGLIGLGVVGLVRDVTVKQAASSVIVNLAPPPASRRRTSSAPETFGYQPGEYNRPNPGTSREGTPRRRVTLAADQPAPRRPSSSSQDDEIPF